MKLSLLILALPLSLVADSVYTDQAAFLAALQNIPNTTVELENFNSSEITALGLSVTTNAVGGPGFGFIANGVWSDCVGHSCFPKEDSRTTWNFAKPTFAFGATFGYEGDQNNPDAPGLSFDFNLFNPPLANGFYGFLSDLPFDTVAVTQNAWKQFPPDIPLFEILREQNYTMDNLYFAEDAPAPEPSTWALLVIGSLLVWWGTKRGTKTGFCSKKASK